MDLAGTLELVAKVGIPTYLSYAAVKLMYRWISIKLKEMENDGNICLGDKCPHRIAAVSHYTDEDLRNHRIFSYIKHCQTNKIPYIRIRDKARKSLVVDFLHCKFDSLAKAFANLIDNGVAGLDRQELESILIDTVSAAARQSDSESSRIAFVRGGSDAMNVFASKYKEMQATTADQIIEYIMATCSSTWLDDGNIPLVASVLDFLVSICHKTLADAEMVMGELNGDLTGKMYAGKPIEGHKPSGARRYPTPVPGSPNSQPGT